MIKICCYIILVVSIVRYFTNSQNNSLKKANFLLLSALIQTLMFNPFSFFSINIKDVVLPFCSNMGLLYQSLIVLLIFILNLGKKRLYSIGNFLFVSISFIIAFVISYSTPYNINIQATNIAWLMLAQVLITVCICRLYISENIMLASFYDAFQIIIWVQFLISFAAIFLGIYSIQDMFLGEDKDSLTFTATRAGALLLIPSGTTSHHNFLGSLCAFISVFFYSCMLYGYKTKKSRFLFFLSIATLLLSQSRGAIIACFVAIVSLYLVSLYHKKKISIAKILTLLGGLTVMSLLLMVVPFFRSMFIESNLDSMGEARFLHYEMGLELISYTQWQGTGLNTHLFLMNQILQEASFDAWSFTRPIHNIHLVIFVELGVIGFVLWVYYFFSRIKKFIMFRDEEMNNPVICSTFFCMLIIFLIHGMVDVVSFRYQYLIMLFLFGVFCNRKESLVTKK